MAYLHGVETVEVTKGPVPVTVVKSAVIALVGSAPDGPVNQLTLVNSAVEAAAFGKKISGFTIPHALDAIFKQGAGSVLVVNVVDVDATDNLAQVTNESQTIANRKVKTAFVPFKDAVVVKNSGGTVTYVLDTDYTIDSDGEVTIINDALTDGTVLKLTYKKFDASTVDEEQLIGEIDGTSGVKTGTKLFLDAFNTFGVNPKIIIAPGFSTLEAIAVEMISIADKYRGIALIDAPLGTTVANAIAGRGPAGDINFYTSSKRAFLLYPHLTAFNEYTGANEQQPYSQFMAGVMAATDNTDGYWFSPSNREIKGIVGTEVVISWAINDETSQANTLNAAGITCYAAGFGTGIRTWGNRSAAYPTSTAPDNFISVRRTADVLHESVELAMLQFIDKPLNQAIIDSIRETVNSFIRTLISRGALIDGLCSFDKAKNPDTELAAGHLTFDLTFMPPTPGERFTFDSFIDITLLKKLA
jgi:phage tail sheath protein FI